MKAEKQILPDISNHRYTVSIARTDAEIEKALELRYRVFYEELHREFNSSSNIDQDKYDDQCHHLIVTENQSQKVVGTYRLQTYEQAVSGEGFYSESLFNLNELPGEILSQSFEVGRACIEEEHRSGRVLFLLWKGFAGYLQALNKRYLLGSLGIPAKSPQEALAIYNELEEQGVIHKEYRVSAKEPYRQNGEARKTVRQKKFKASGLLENYLSVGCDIISKPAYHQDLELLYVMIFMDIEKITPRIKKMFFG
ncbi:MAG: GNAT family N-acetyltransferase [Gracilimonas sp.]|uniref:GNAT family N-acetyltransferase n=1 Tax=Gracilimonas sp. TaxID=1974203 RepID=UPI001984215D|nr:GNAT family N-acetyltransferase [Gracilimonas sp.]MBD3617432.1 GNAT family N-acetyltransferase [Gracilimonas sp.]